MSILVRVEEIKKKIMEIAALDPNYQLFGANIHRYQFCPPLNEETVSGLEEKWGFSLPESYRYWITTVGNGGVGSGLGLQALRGDVESYGDDFPGTDQAYELVDEDDSEEENRWLQGTITLADTGVGYCNNFVLVVKGQAYGAVWLEQTMDELIWTPKYDDFLDWMEEWAEWLLDKAKKAHQEREDKIEEARSKKDCYRLGQIYQDELNKPHHAEIWFQRAREQDPNDFDAILGHAKAFNDIGFHESAMNIARKYREYCNPKPKTREPQYWPLLTYELGRALHARGQYAEAAEALDLAQERLRRDLFLYVPPRIESHLRIGNVEEARWLLRRALRGGGISLRAAGIQYYIFIDHQIEDKALRTIAILEAMGLSKEAAWLQRLKEELDEN